MTTATIPATHLSVSTVNGRRCWRTIHRGMPLCADQDSPERPTAVYREHTGERRFGVEVPLWDGDEGEMGTWTL